MIGEIPIQVIKNLGRRLARIEGLPTKFPDWVMRARSATSTKANLMMLNIRPSFTNVQLAPVSRIKCVYNCMPSS